jgi:hypothetical protein
LGTSNLDGYRNIALKEKTPKNSLKMDYKTRKTRHEALLKKLTS